MSADEDTELRDLVAQTLEANGVLGKIRAQLRASVFLALEEQESVQNKGKFSNPELKSFLATKEGRVVAGLVREFLEHFNLEFSAAVFEPETGAGEHYESRNSLARDLDIIESDATTKQPLLAEVVKRSYGGQPQRGRSGSGTESSSSSSSSLGVDSKNKRNLDSDRSQGSRASPRSPSSPVNKKEVNIYGDFDSDDAFFDDPMPKNENSTFNVTTSDKSKKDSNSAGGLSSLGGLPPLNGPSSDPHKVNNAKGNDLEKDIKAIDKKIADLGFDVPNDDDYEDDDFESSKSLEDRSVSPYGVTPRSQKSDANVKSIDEDIAEDIEEEISVAEDLLKSDHSGMDDLTTDRTVSPIDHSSAFDYMEEVTLP